MRQRRPAIAGRREFDTAPKEKPRRRQMAAGLSARHSAAIASLGIGLIYFCLRYIAAEQHPFGERIGQWAAWSSGSC
jgi:hypothetical protein